MDLLDCYECSVQVIRFNGLGVQNLNLIVAARNSEDGTVVEVGTKLVGIKSSTGDNQSEVLSFLKSGL
jgi:hypothetical protein